MFKATRSSLLQLSRARRGHAQLWGLGKTPLALTSKLEPVSSSYSLRYSSYHCYSTLASFPASPQPALHPMTPAAGTWHQLRHYRSGRTSRSTEEEERPQPHRATPQLMEFPWVVWPSLWHSIRNWIFANLLIHRYLDQEFSMTSFKKGAIQALVYVSEQLSKGNFEALQDLVTKQSLEEIQKNFAHFSLKQRLDLAVAEEDIFFSFPYQIGMIFTNEGGPKERIFVEVTMCYHVFRGFQDYISSTTSGETQGGLRGLYDHHDRISIANYRFIREFTKGVVDDWTISLANHFKPGDINQPH